MKNLLTIDRIAAALVWLALTTVTALGQIAPDPNQGYPAPETATATMPPMTWPACTPNCSTNTPVVDARPAATARPGTGQGGAVRLYVPMVVRFR